MQDNQEVKCSKVRKCKWKGKYSDLVEVQVKGEPSMTESCCPKCGHNEFYEIKEG